LNSSKQLQAPAEISPLKNLAMECVLRPSEQLNTTHYIANALAKSLVLSVFPVPAGPSGAPPKFNCKALISVL
jgi:hypothetical protein